jgi:hypothetical protein
LCSEKKRRITPGDDSSRYYLSGCKLNLEVQVAKEIEFGEERLASNVKMCCVKVKRLNLGGGKTAHAVKILIENLQSS